MCCGRNPCGTPGREYQWNSLLSGFFDGSKFPAVLQQLIKEHGIVEESEGESDDEGEIRLVETKKEQPAAQQGQQGAAGAPLVESGIDLSVSVGVPTALMWVYGPGLFEGTYSF